MDMANSKPPRELEMSLYKLVFHSIRGEEPSSVFSDAAQDVSRDASSALHSTSHALTNEFQKVHAAVLSFLQHFENVATQPVEIGLR